MAEKDTDLLSLDDMIIEEDTDTDLLSLDDIITGDTEVSDDTSQDVQEIESVLDPKLWGGLVKLTKASGETVSGDTSEDIEVEDLISLEDIEAPTGVYKDVGDYGKVGRDDLIQEWSNKYGYGKGGFHFERDRRGIQIDAPNGEKMIVPYASNMLGFEDTEGETYWGKGHEMGHALAGVEGRKTTTDLQKEVANFINNNQNPEVDETQKKVGGEFKEILKKELLPVLQKMADENPNIAYSGDTPTPINTLTKSDLWGEEIYSELLKEIVDKYGEGEGEEPLH